MTKLIQKILKPILKTKTQISNKYLRPKGPECRPLRGRVDQNLSKNLCIQLSHFFERGGQQNILKPILKTKMKTKYKTKTKNLCIQLSHIFLSNKITKYFSKQKPKSQSIDPIPRNIPKNRP